MASNRASFVCEVVFNAAIFLLGIAVIAGSIGLGFGGLKQPGAGLFPFFAGLAICLGEVLVIFRSISRAGDDMPFLVDGSGFRKLAALIAVLMVWMLAMPVLGYIVVTFAAVFAFAKLLGLKGWLKPLMLSAGTSLLVYILFDRLLYLDLPRGILS